MKKAWIIEVALLVGIALLLGALVCNVTGCAANSGKVETGVIKGNEIVGIKNSVQKTEEFVAGVKTKVDNARDVTTNAISESKEEITGHLSDVKNDVKAATSTVETVGTKVTNITEQVESTSNWIKALVILVLFVCVKGDNLVVWLGKLGWTKVAVKMNGAGDSK